ncbi:unnamed protein product, partial [Mesorhabditis belari]|uniref:Choline/carnitine acyltransferase domain-containing protein n=1 Tax=Mesorhabditis belari TaxID=2138241 RepID=A0AAF3FQ59_9BILA
MVALRKLSTNVQLSLRTLPIVQTRMVASDQGKTRYIGQPKLPAPDPSLTLKKYFDYGLAISKQTRTGEHREKAAEQDVQQIINNFRDNEMPKLQKLLENRAEKLNNWLTPWWLDVAYLAARTPLPVVTSPGVLFPQWPSPSKDPLEAQIHHATTITMGALQFYHDVTKELLPQDTAGKEYMDMSQYKFLFGTSRLPRIGNDLIRYGTENKNPNKHIVLMRNGHAVVVPVITQHTSLRDFQAIQKAIREAVSVTDTRNINQLGIVSGGERDQWAKVYKNLESNITNARSLRLIEEALFIVCIDQPTKPLAGYTEKDEQARSTLHGSGSKANSGNRWFDKTIQFIIGQNGFCGMTYEHTPAEGPPVARLMDFICDKVNDASWQSHGDSESIKVEKLEFELDDSVKDSIARNAKEMDSVVDDLEVSTYTFKDFGKNFPKKAKISPDSFIQMAFQLAYYRLHHKVPPTYETATLRLFSEGRTENIRLPNRKSRDMCEMLSNKKAAHNDMYKALREATESHQSLAKECMSNKGMDRHLLAWKLLAAENELPLPSIFKNDIYKEMMHFRVSTSQVPTKNFIQMCFGPAEADCYGICYNPQERELHFAISAFNRDKSTSAKRFAEALGQALRDFKSLCEPYLANPEKKEKSRL